MRRSELHWLLVGTLLTFGSVAFAQIYLPGAPTREPADYGKVVLDTYSSQSGPGIVVFDHWLHRAKFTCRVCHVDVGFAMQAKATGIRAQTNRQGYHCGACHDGKKVFDGKPLFAACPDDPTDRQCSRCHSQGKQGVRKFEYKSFTAKFPKARYGINWEEAEKIGAIHPQDFVEGISTKQLPMKTRPDFSIKAGLDWVHPIVFSHEEHAIWNGCELCHPDIFPTARKDTVQFSMFANIEGRYCGACHSKVAFPLNNCQQCHPRGPSWAQ